MPPWCYSRIARLPIARAPARQDCPKCAREVIASELKVKLRIFFCFYATSADAAEQIDDELRQWNLTKIEIRTTRTLWIFKGWEITPRIASRWGQLGPLDLMADPRGRAFDPLADSGILAPNQPSRYSTLGIWPPSLKSRN